MMRTSVVLMFLAPLAFGLCAYGQSSTQTQAQGTQHRSTQSTTATAPKRRSAGGDIDSGSADIGKGVGKGAGKAGEGGVCIVVPRGRA